jgi:hypothetical protein
MDERRIQQLLAGQDGVISRRQALRLGATPADLRRLVRRRVWARVHPGVFVDHTGPLTWRQRAWAAVLLAAPSALCAESALRAAHGPGQRGHDDQGPIHVAIDRSRTVVTPPGVTAHRLVDLDDRVQWNLAPPRLRVEEAVLDVAAGAVDDFAAIAVLSDAVQSRRTTAPRLRQTLERRNRIARRELLTSVLDDVSTGACSALEHAYLNRVERPHRLPVAGRQVRASSRGPIYRDVVYVRLGLAVELDGRLDHTRATDRDRDLDRDLDAALDGTTTVRLGWGQAVGRPCATAAKLAVLMARLGWTGTPFACPDCDGVGSGSPGDSRSTLSA